MKAIPRLVGQHFLEAIFNLDASNVEVANIYWKGCVQHGSRQHLLEVLEKPQEWAPAVFPISLQIYSKEARKWKLVRSETGGVWQHCTTQK